MKDKTEHLRAVLYSGTYCPCSFSAGNRVCIVACPVQFPWTHKNSVSLTVQIQKKVNRRSVFLELQLIIINSGGFFVFDYVI